MSSRKGGGAAVASTSQGPWPALALVGGLLLAGCHLLFPFQAAEPIAAVDLGVPNVADQGSGVADAHAEGAVLDARITPDGDGAAVRDGPPGEALWGPCSSWSAWTNLEECRPARCEATCGGRTIDCQNALCTCDGVQCYESDSQDSACLCEEALWAGCCSS